MNRKYLGLEWKIINFSNTGFKVTGYNLLINIHEDCFCYFFSPVCSYKDELYAKHKGTPGIIHQT